MIKNLSKISGVAAFAVIASSASAEVKINENLSLDGYAVGALAVTEGTKSRNDTFFDSGDKLLDATKVALNGTYGDFKAKVSLIYVPTPNNNQGNTDEAGLLDAYVTYTQGNIAITAGKFNSWFGYESFDTIFNAFMTYGPADNIGYVTSYATGAKVEYITKEFTAGISARDSLTREGFFKGDGDFSDDVGYEAYFLYTGIEKLTVFLSTGYENTDNTDDALKTYNAWAAYAVSDRLTLVASYANTENFVSFSYTLQATYAVNKALSVSARYGAADGSKDLGLLSTPASNYTDYGVASTYAFNENFSIRSEVNKKDFNDGAPNPFFYAVQGIFKF